MSPHLGQGVNLALEDAACFAQCLEAEQGFVAASEEFVRQRRRKLRYYQSVTRLLTPFFQSGSKTLAFGRNLVLPLLPSWPWVGPMMQETLWGTRSGWFS